MLHSFMIAQRVISAAIAREAGSGARARGTAPAPGHAWTNSQRRLVQALARSTTRTERQTFVVNLGTELLAVLDARRPGNPRTVLRQAITQLLRTQTIPVQAGIGIILQEYRVIIT